MRRFFGGLLLTALVLSSANAAHGALLYSENFETDHTANWTTNNGTTDSLVDYHYDYSGIGVPAAPGGGSTFGLKMTANNSGGVLSGVSVSPTGQNFTGSYRVSFNLWQNFVGPLPSGGIGAGTTQLSTFGIGTAGNVAFTPPSLKESVGFAVTLDGGSASDYRAYTSAAGTSYTSGNAVYSAPGGAINNTNAYYNGLGLKTVPAAQTGLFASQTGTTADGVLAFAWRAVTIDVDDVAKTAVWAVDGLKIAQVDLTTVTLGGGNIFFGHSDTNPGISASPNAPLLNVTLIDNIRVTSVPEPSALGLCLIGATLTLVRRRRC